MENTPKIASIELETMNSPHQILKMNGERKVFAVDTPPGQWPDSDARFDKFIRGAGTTYRVTLNWFSVSGTSTQILESRTPHPSFTNNAEFLKALESWDFYEVRRPFFAVPLASPAQ